MKTRVTGRVARRRDRWQCGGRAHDVHRWAQKPQDQPVFHTSTTAAVVDVIVRDRTGQPVQDLTEADFEILEDGVPQRIISFESHTSGSAAPVPAARRDARSSPGADGPTQSLVALVFQQLPHQSRAMAVEAARRRSTRWRRTSMPASSPSN